MGSNWVREMRAIVLEGINGQRALNEYGEGYFNYIIAVKESLFLDQYRSTIPVISISQYLMLGGDLVLLAVDHDVDQYYWLLKDKGFSCEIYQPLIESYYSKNTLIYNPYEIKSAYESEQEWNDDLLVDDSRRYIFALSDSLYNKQVMFDHVEIETYNRCNGSCSFCPVNKKSDSRKEMFMSEELFRHIINQLKELDYKSSFALFSNNEPFLDDRIVGFQRYARAQLPKARMYLFTNGTVLTLEKFLQIIDYLDELIIDNYNQSLQLIPNVKKIRDYCEAHRELYSKVTIVLRHPREVLTSRGGCSPNRSNILNVGTDRCVLPFRQLIVRPDGKVSACCNDALGQMTLGDLQTQSITEVWNGNRFSEFRKMLLAGRSNVEICSKCDSFIKGLRMTRNC